VSGLVALQQWLHGALLDPGAVDGVARDATLLASPLLSAADGLAIYQRGYRARLTACMRQQFPALCHALGGALFDDFVADYIRAHPPERHTLYDLGRRFPDFLDAGRPVEADGSAALWGDFMVDLARFERALFMLYDAPGCEGQALADHATPDRSLRLQPAVTIGRYRFGAAGYYHAVRRGEAPDLPPIGPCHVAMVRVDFITRTYLIGADDYLLFAQMLEGGTVIDGLADIAVAHGVSPDSVRASWAAPGGPRERWITAGMFVGG
jgi:hypothetical protein